VARARRPLRIRRLDLRKTLFVLPNLVTLGSVFCGVTAIRLVGGDEVGPRTLIQASQLILVAMVFDLLDGRVARMTRTQSAFGLQLDSLADVISFGVAPAMLAYAWGLGAYPQLGLFASFSFVACGAIRLARFNVLASTPTGQPAKPGRYMVGLPIPAAAGMLVSLVMTNPSSSGFVGPGKTAVIPFAILFALGLLMVSTIPFRSFKDLRFDRPTLLLVAFLVLSSLLVWQAFRPESVVVWLLFIYVSMGLLEGIRLAARRLHGVPERKSIPPVA
jgi:CDP-diacylglycerol---serine O-phosphatidyltransferase